MLLRPLGGIRIDRRPCDLGAGGAADRAQALDGLAHHAAARRQVRVDKVGVFQLRRGTDDPIHILRWRELHMWAALEERLRPGDRFVDAGANIGFYALRALAGRAGGSVVAIEMMPGTAASLRANVAASGADNVTVVEKALAERMATARGECRSEQAGPGLDRGGHEGGRSLRLTVETARLDTLIPEGRVALMKMDLEGADLARCRAPPACSIGSMP